MSKILIRSSVLLTATAILVFSGFFIASPVFAVGTNGSFEIGTDPGAYATLNPVDTNITDWTINSGSVDYIGTYWQALNGERSIDLNGLAEGSISQTFPTVIGATYDVTFDLSGNPDSRSDVYDLLYSPPLKDMSVSATGASSQDFTFDTSVMGNSLSNMLWENHKYSFVATATSTTLTFASTIPGAFGPALDNVLIAETLPVITATCPQGTNQSPSPIGTVTVDSASSTAVASSNNLLSGGTYLLVSSGTWENTGKNSADSEYASTDSWSTYMDGYNIDPYFLGEGEFDLQVDGAFVNWGSYNPNHVYSSLYTGTGNPVNLMVFDGNSNPTPVVEPGWYGDNLGTLSVDIYSCNPANVSVHTIKYLDGVHATAENANSAVFPMETTFNASNIGSYENVPFTLDSNGWYGDPAYEASFSNAVAGSSYSDWEVTGGNVVGDSCESGQPYALVGYTTGVTLEESTKATPILTVPSFPNLTSNEYVIVWNKTCPPIPTLKVHVLKYLDGQLATSATANNYQFPMTATWKTANLNGGVQTTGTYVLGNNHGGAPDQYGADTAVMNAPADYATSEITNDSQVVDSPELCVPGKSLLNGYRTSALSFVDAANKPLSGTASFAGLVVDQYVIVDNSNCPTTGSLTIEKYAIGGNSTFNFTSDIPGGASFVITTVAGVGYSQTFANLTPGTYHVTEVNMPKGWTQTDNECSAITVTAGQSAICAVTNTSNKLLGLIRGTKYIDRDGDGTLKDGDHHRLAGVTIYLDTNNNSALDAGEPSTVTDSHGNYRFNGLVAGTYYVREVVQTGWVQTAPVSGVYKITLTAGKVSKKNNFGNFKPGTISGMKFNDENANGRKDNNETGLAGWTINLKGPHGFTASTVTGADGSYSFANLGAGVYTLSEVMQTGWTQTAHPGSVRIQSGTVSAKNNFGNTQKTIHKPDKDHDYDHNGHGNPGRQDIA